jgi:oligopeptide/dipeptide ABC transporter, ATP-binding protein, C-terminal domain
MSDKILEIKDCEIQYITEIGIVHAVNHIDFSIERGASMGLVGETGAGKTTTCLGILNLLPSTTGRVTSGEIIFNGENLLKKSDKEMQKIRGSQISMVFQDPMTALNPTQTIGDQIVESIRHHQKCSKRDAWDQMKDMLAKVGIEPERADDYPHQFSGGMKQRVVIAMALACNPSLLLADEPTSALDVTIQAQVLEMIKSLQDEFQTAMLLITHDLGVVAEVCSTVGIMYAGEIVEYSAVEEFFENTVHPYSQGLIAAIPRLDESVKRLNVIPGMMPDPMDLPSGCKFHTRCPYATELCKTCVPSMREVSPGHAVKCHMIDSIPKFSRG